MMLMDEVETLIGKLKSQDAHVRKETVEALGWLKDARAVEPLIAALKDEDRYVYTGAAWALGKIGEPAVEPLIKALKDLDGLTPEVVGNVLVRIGEPSVGPLVEASKKTGNEHLRGTIAKILWYIDRNAKRIGHDFGCKEKGVFRAPKIPDEFRNVFQKAMLDKAVKVRV